MNHPWSGQGGRRVLCAVLLGWLLVGLWLRLQQLPAQWLTDDEWHALHQILSGAGYRELFLRVGIADFSVPQAWLYAWLGGHVPLTEWMLRLPMLLCGLALLGLGAWAVWQRYGALVASLFVGLAAVSPLLINYSRNARPYGVTVLLVWVALWALMRWRQTAAWRWMLLYACCALGACWWHSAVAPFVLIPFAALWLECLWRACRGGSWRRLAGLTAVGAALAVVVAVVVLLPLWLNREVLSHRMGSDLPELATLSGVWHVWFGMADRWLVLLFLALAAYGAFVLLRRRDELFLLGLAGLAATLASIWLTEPAWVHLPLTFGRYLLPALPLLLLSVALGAAELLGKLPRKMRPFFGGLAVLVLPLANVMSSPASALLVQPNNFTLHMWYQFEYREHRNVVREIFLELPESPFWGRLAAEPAGSLRLAVTGHALESFTLTDVRWQELHRQTVFNGQRQGLCGTAPFWGEIPPEDARFDLRMAVDLADEADLARAGIDYVVFNRVMSEVAQQQGIDECIERFAQRHGAPVHVDEQLVAFALGRVGTGDR